MTILRIDSHIEDRARLMFVFPGPDTDSIRILPFFENVHVKESKAAKLIKYNPIGRSSNSFGYIGADSRKLSLSFNMTLPNIASVATMHLDPRMNHRKRAVEELQDSFFPRAGAAMGHDPVHAPAMGTTAHDSLKYEQKWRDILGEGNAIPPASATLVDDNHEEFLLLQHIAATTRSPGLLEPPSTHITRSLREGEAINSEIKLKYRMIDTIVFWANLIRSSVLNNSKNPFYGPPTVRLTYGVLYQDIPCVCSSYRISADDKAGYDQRTMLPRVIGVSMELLEVREGDRGPFNPGVSIERDNLTGWESVIKAPHTTDPMELI